MPTAEQSSPSPEKRKTSPLEEAKDIDTSSVDQEDSDSDVAPPPAKRGRLNAEQDTGPAGLFLDTVNRYMLDFDFEKLCSVSLSNLNVYACLVCGKYYQGKILL